MFRVLKFSYFRDKKNAKKSKTAVIGHLIVEFPPNRR